MAHVRKQLRDAVKTLLAGLSGVNTVTGLRSRPFAESELPAVTVMTTRETIAYRNQGEAASQREITLDILIFALGEDGQDDVLDAISAQIETRIEQVTGGIWDGVILRKPITVDLAEGEQKEKTLHSLRLSYSIRISSQNAETIG